MRNLTGIKAIFFKWRMSDGVCNPAFRKRDKQQPVWKDNKPKSVAGVKGVRTVRTKVQEEVIFWSFGSLNLWLVVSSNFGKLRIREWNGNIASLAASSVEWYSTVHLSKR